MFATLKQRLTLSLTLITIALGGAAVGIGQWAMMRYFEELTQTLNRDLAMYVTAEHRLLEAKLGRSASIEELSRQAMIINPIAEVYLLTPEGRIDSHAQAPDSIRRERVDLAPIHQFLQGHSTFPLRGNDPHHPNRDKIFSVSAIETNGTLDGYIYVILGGHQYDQLQQAISWSHIRQQSAWALALMVAAALLIGALLFRTLTTPLSRLSQRMQSYAGRHTAPPQSPPQQADEIAELAQIFERMSAQIDQQIAQLQESDRLRRELISNVSHDLRTPLATLQGYLETLRLKDERLNQAQRHQYLLTAERNCQRLAQLISQLFELSKLESGSTAPIFEEFSLAELMHDTAQEFALTLERQALSLSIDTPADAVTVCADISLIQRVFDNLIRNAIAHTPAGGHIRLSVTPAPSTVAIRVSDSGSGITGDDLPFIFERFYQSSDQPKSDPHSSGLGLAIVKRILDLHGCRIEVQSTANHGTTFVFDLPLEAPVKATA